MNSTVKGSGISIQALQGGGLMGELIRNYDWSATSLGDFYKWPYSLQSALGICINSNFPIAIYWGPDLILIYNDAWSSIPGNKHPWALGKPATQVWPDIWPDIEPQFQLAFTGQPGGSKDALLPMQRHGYTEECYFDFTFTPIYGDSGNIDGIFNAVIETTFRVINERRAGTIQRLAQRITPLQSINSVLEATSLILQESELDTPFHLIYLNNQDNDFKLAKGDMHLQLKRGKTWPFDRSTKTSVLIENADDYFVGTLKGPWPEQPTRAYITPLTDSDGSNIGYLVLGISARLNFDKDYQSFLDSITNILGRQLIAILSLNVERSRAQALAEIDKAKTTFFSNISHEFRTPLTLILSPLESVLSSASYLEDAHLNDLKISLRNTIRLQKLVNTLLDFSRMEAGKMEASPSQIDIITHTAELASAFRSAIEAAGIEYLVKLQPIESEVWLDENMWDKIVLNLISNAFKYTKQGQIEVCLEEENKHLVLKVRDTGIGISTSDKDKIFERFYRANNSEGRSQEGTGIGLSLVKELVHLHGGTISVQSEPGQGSEFKVLIPLKEDHIGRSKQIVRIDDNKLTRRAFSDEALKWNENNKPVRETENQDPENSSKPKVLLADDNSDMREYLERLFDTNYSLRSVSNGIEAYDLAMSWRPDLILSDIMMPGMDGFQLLSKLKSNLATRNIPVIFLSARSGEEAKVEGLEAGADDYLVKPFSARELIARVQNHIAISRTRTATEKQFYNLFLQSPAHIHVMKGPEHILEFFHPLGKPFVGGKDITGMTIREAIPEVEGQGYFEMLDSVYREGKSIFLPESKASFPQPDGTNKDFYFNTTYLPWKDMDGKIQGVLQFTFDVTAQATSNLKIKESEERFRLLVTSMPQIVWIADANGTIEYLSEQWKVFTDQDPGEGIHVFSSLIHRDDIDEVRAKWKTALENNLEWSAEFRLKNLSTNSYTWFSGKTVPLKDDQGRVIKWIGSASDISLQKQQNELLTLLVAERTEDLRNSNTDLQRSNEDLQQFAHVTSHDLKEPVRKIKVYNNLLKSTHENLLDETGKNYIRKIERATDRIYAMIEGVLQYSSVNAITIQAEEIDLTELCKTITEDLEILITEKNASIKIDALPRIAGSRTLIHQLFYNLLNNSLKFVRPGVAPVIEIRSCPIRENELELLGLNNADLKYCKIEISDNGIGFDQVYADEIFDSFMRLNPKDKFEGTGLGLALCKKIVSRHGGQIMARSKQGEGSTFTVYLSSKFDKI